MCGGTTTDSGLGPHSQGCSCLDLGTPCKEYEKADAIFLGTVLSHPHPWTRFTVQRGYKGVDAGEITIRTGLSTDPRVSDSCQYHLKEGEKYVVYARWWPAANELYAGACNRIRPFQEADADVEYLEGVLANDSGAMVFGEARKQDLSLLEGVTIILERQGSQAGYGAEAITNQVGHFLFKGLLPGTYLIRSEPKRGLVLGIPSLWESSPIKILLLNEHDCSEVRFLEEKPNPNSSFGRKIATNDS